MKKKVIIYLSLTLSLLSEGLQYQYNATYSDGELLKNKELYKSKIRNSQEQHHVIQRALLTISADDADYIPKIADAGKIFNDETGAYQFMHNGIKIVRDCYNGSWMTDVISGLKGHHEPQEEKCFYEVLKYIPENAVMIELGASWAYYSLWFAHQVKNAKNYLIEPNIKLLEVGKRNFELNNKVGIFRRGFAGKLLENYPEHEGAEFISIDDFIEIEKIEHVNILHADIQGGEVEMLKTTVKNLDKIDYFFISTHDGDSIHKECLRFFKYHDFIILAEHTIAQSCSGDGLIIAKRKNVAGPEHIDIKKY